ncbi:hypothetical protein DC31_09395 [Microbacterium sp. CH12i]|nr:hypothetical protein DC31_09395 [Microbacterium sp. CH12i]
MKPHRSPDAAAVGADPHRFRALGLAGFGEHARNQGCSLGCARRGDAARRCAYQLGMQDRPRRISVTFMPVAAGQTRCAARDDKGTDRGPTRFECDRQVREVVSQIAGELLSGCCAVDEHDSHGVRVGAIRRHEPFITQGDLRPGFDA